MEKSGLKQNITEGSREVLNEMETFKKLFGDEDWEKTFHQYCQDCTGCEDCEDVVKSARYELDVIKRAGFDKKYEALMNGIFLLPVEEFDKRIAAIEVLKKQACRIVGNHCKRYPSQVGGGMEK